MSDTRSAQARAAFQERLQRYGELRDAGAHPEDAAREVGITPFAFTAGGTHGRYERWWKRSRGVPLADADACRRWYQ